MVNCNFFRSRLKYLKMRILILGIFTFVVVSGLKEGDSCNFKDINTHGTCKNIIGCRSAMNGFTFEKITMCSTAKGAIIVCCADENVISKPIVNTKPSMLTNVTVTKSVCEQLDTDVPRPRRKAVEKCIEYQEKFVYPCQESLTPNGGEIRVNHCNRKPEDLIIGGENARIGEFPHMVLLSYDNTTTKTSTTDLHCGGSIISERFILTAAHCTYSKIRGPVRRIRIGFLKMSDPVDMNNEYTVKKVYKHTNYKSPILYNDIALLESDRPMNLNRFAVPVCLHDGSSINNDEVYAAGWGTVRYMINNGSDTLQKVILEKFSDEECLNNYPPYERRHMTDGYDSQTQVCYGHRTSSKDSCQGDSGGPVQIKHPQLRCMYMATGIVSIGTRCGVPGVPGIYTRIGYYLDWIESIVWP